MSELIKRNVAYTWKEEEATKAEKCLAIAKEIEKGQKKTKHWVKKSHNTWIFTSKKLKKEEAIRNHDKNIKESQSINDLKWKNRNL